MTLEQRAGRLAGQAVGHTITIRLPGDQRHVKVTGEIVSAEYAGVRHAGRTEVAQFRVLLRCGTAIRPFTVEKLPR